MSEPKWIRKDGKSFSFEGNVSPFREFFNGKVTVDFNQFSDNDCIQVTVNEGTEDEQSFWGTVEEVRDFADWLKHVCDRVDTECVQVK